MPPHACSSSAASSVVSAAARRAARRGRSTPLRARSAIALEIVEAPDVIEMTDKPSAAIRGKPNSSMIVGLKLQAERRVRRVRLGRQHRRANGGVDGRAASCTPDSSGRRSPRSFPRRAIRSSCSTPAPTSIARPTSWSSSRGSASSTPRICSAATNPAVGLLSIGEEPEKGNAVVEGSAPAPRSRPASISSATSRGATSPPARATAVRSTSSCATGSSATCVLKFYEAVAPLIIALAREGRRGSRRR